MSRFQRRVRSRATTTEIDEYAALSLEFRERCGERYEPLHELSSELVEIPRCQHPLHVRLPRVGEYCHPAEAEISKFPFAQRVLRVLDEAEALRRFTAALKPSPSEHGGCIRLAGENTAEIHLGRRRPREISQAQLAEGLAYFQEISPRWQGCFFNPEFYPRVIAPHFRGEPAKSPIEWAAERMKVVAGYICVCAGGDLPVQSAEYPFMEMARFAGNLRPRGNPQRLRYELDPERKALLETLRGKFGAALSPELLAFSFEHSAALADVRASEEFNSFAEIFSRAVERGLVVPRASTLFAAMQAEIKDPRRRLEVTNRVLQAVYLQPESPWWFHENFEFAVEAPLLGKSGERYIMLAEAAGPAFEYAAQVAASVWPELSRIGGLEDREIARGIAQVSRDFGVGNPKRAERCLKFALAALGEASLGERAQTFNSCLEVLHRHRPSSEIIGILEGPEADFSKPGFPHLVATFFPGREWGEKICPEFSVSAEVLALTWNEAQKPLAERAALPPPISGNFDGRPLLVSRFSKAGGALLPPINPECGAVTVDSSPLRDWLAFDCQVAEECATDPKRVAGLYFGLCAAKMPKPFRPPPGFLKFLDVYAELPDPNYDFSGLFARGERSNADHSNAQSRLERHKVVAGILDAWNFGLLTWEAAEATFTWIVEPVTAFRSKGKGVSQDTDEPPDWEQRQLAEMESNRRIAALQNFFLAPKVLSQLISAELLEAPQVKPGFERALHGLVAAQNSTELIQPFESSREASELVTAHAIEELKRLKILSPNRVSQRLMESGGDFSAVCAEVAKLMALTQRTVTALGETHRFLIRTTATFRDVERAANEIETETGKVRARFGEEWADSPIAESGALDRLIEEHFWTSRYLRAEKILGAFREKPESTPIDAKEAAFPALQSSRQIVQRLWLLEACLGRVSFEARDPRVTVSGESDKTASNIPQDVSAFLDRLPELEHALLRKRRDFFGLLPVGGKIHVIHKVDSERLQYLCALLGLKSSGFRLQHADSSLVLPPMVSADELKFVVNVLAAERVVNLEYPELQVTLGGRLTPGRAALLGASVLLCTEQGVRYDRRAFATTHDSDTGFRIMAYDAGGHLEVFPFGTSGSGRTDMLGRRHLGDIDRYQIIGSVLGHEQSGGPFAHLAAPFRAHVEQILVRYGLGNVLSESWIRDPEAISRESGLGPWSAGARHFDHAVAPCVEAWFHCFDLFEKTGEVSGIVAEMRSAFERLRGEVRLIQQQLLLASEQAENRSALLGGARGEI